MNNLPIFIKLQDEKCLVVGGGMVATRKIKQLLNAGAKIFVVAIKIKASLKEAHKLGKIHCQEEKYSEKHLEGKRIVIAATNDKKLNNKIAEQAKSKNLSLIHI